MAGLGPNPNWGAFFLGVIKTLQKMADDLKANKPLAPQPALTSAGIAAGGEKLLAIIPPILKWVTANPGAVTATDDFLEYLASEGWTWAEDIEAGVDAAPGALVMAKADLPTLLGFLNAFQPAPQPIDHGPER